MEHKLDVHIPQQFENLLQTRASSDIDSFEYILEGLKNIIRTEPKLLSGLDMDNNQRIKEKEKLLESVKKRISNAMDNKKTDEVYLALQTALRDFEAEYITIERNYMNGVVETFTSYQSLQEGESIE